VTLPGDAAIVLRHSPTPPREPVDRAQASPRGIVTTDPISSAIEPPDDGGDVRAASSDTDVGESVIAPAPEADLSAPARELADRSPVAAAPVSTAAPDTRADTGSGDTVIDAAPETEVSTPPREVADQAPVAAAPARARELAVPPSVPAAPREPVISTATRTVGAGDTFSVRLPGPGWLYLGAADGVEYRDRRADSEGVTFTFRLLADSGDETLRFEAQDLRSGRTRQHAERILPDPGELAVVTPREGTAPYPGGGVPAAGQAGGGQGGAGATEETGRPDDEGSSGDGDSADGRASEGAAAGELSLTEVDRLLAGGDRAAAVAILEEMRATGLGNEDELLFRLAEILESEWEGRDLQRSRSIYQEIVVGFPLSLFRRPSQRRIEYLDRHFFLIR
jgi:hypothetical protein